MRFLADMCVDLRIVEWLRSRGHDVTHLGEEGLHRLSDREIFTKAGGERRTILTFDLDFGEIAASAADQGIGIIVFRLRNTRTAHVIARLDVVLTVSASALEQGSIVVVEESRHRVRYLPIGESRTDEMT